MSKKPTSAAPQRASAPTLTVVPETTVPPTLTVVADVPVTPTVSIAVADATPPPHTPTKGLKIMLNTVDFAAIGKENLEAFTVSSKIWTTGVQDLTKEFAASAKASFEESVAAFKALTTVKSIKEAIELQTSYSKSAVEKALAESKKMTEASLKLTEQAMAPITARVAVAVGSFSKAA
jgi:phasin family protein